MIELTEKVSEATPDDFLVLPYELRQKSRLRTQLVSGQHVAVMLNAGTILEDGDVLKAEDGTTVGVVAAEERLSTAFSDDLLLLARVCYHLGNRHVTLQVGPGWVRYQPDHVLDEMVRGLGLQVRSESAKFEPERGAYHGHSHSHSHRKHDH
ncbi:MAG: urease accessory protein UreE [Myxococcales bacterium]|nr:urease accessory protein UreE [Myxococcales bacterium]